MMALKMTFGLAESFRGTSEVYLEPSCRMIASAALVTTGLSAGPQRVRTRFEVCVLAEANVESELVVYLDSFAPPFSFRGCCRNERAARQTSSKKAYF